MWKLDTCTEAINSGLASDEREKKRGGEGIKPHTEAFVKPHIPSEFM